MRVLVEELQALGAADAAMDEHGYVMATIPATPGHEQAPVIGFVAHVDTSPEMPGDGVARSSTRTTTGATSSCPTIPRRSCEQRTNPRSPRRSATTS